MEDLVVFFRDSTTAALKMLKDDDEDDNLEAVLDVVATQSSDSTNTSNEIAEESAPAEVTQETVHPLSS